MERTLEFPYHLYQSLNTPSSPSLKAQWRTTQQVWGSLLWALNTGQWRAGWSSLSGASPWPSSPTWASAQQQIYSGFHKEFSCPSGLTLSRQDINSEGDPAMEEESVTRSAVWSKTVFGLFKRQMGTLSSVQCQRISFPLLPDFQKWIMFSFLWEGSRNIKLLNNACFPWELLSKGRYASLRSLLPHDFGIQFWNRNLFTQEPLLSALVTVGVTKGRQSVSSKINRNWALAAYWPVYI